MKRSNVSLKPSKSSIGKSRKQKNYRIVLKQRGDLATHQDSCTSILNCQSIKNQSPLNKSMIESVKNISQSKISHSNLSQNKNKETNNPTQPEIHSSTQKLNSKIDQMTLQQIQKKVDELIMAKLMKTKEGIHKRNQVSQINNKMNQIMQFICQSNFQCSAMGVDEELEIGKRKITIIEKLMAQNSVESQAVKKYFQGKRINSKTKHPWQYKYRFNTTQLLSRQFSKQLINNSSVSFESTNRCSFKAPDKKYYVIKPKKAPYQFKSQPLPRSTYNREFLIYGTIPRFSYKQNESNVMPVCSARSQNSAYRADFTTKTVQKLNIKQLDCYRDKFKDIKISFIGQTKPSHQKSMQSLENNTALLNQKSNHINTSVKYLRPQTQQCHYVESLNTECQNNYKGEISRIISEIKHKQLNDLKYAYKGYACS